MTDPVRSVVVGSVTLALGLVGCGDDDKRVETTGDDPHILVFRGATEAAHSMASNGRLGYDSASRCLRLERGGQVQAPVWPRGTKPISKDGKYGVHVPDVGDLFEGAQISSGEGGPANPPKDLTTGCVLESGLIVLDHIARQK